MTAERRLEPVVILRNRHMTIAHRAIFHYSKLLCYNLPWTFREFVSRFFSNMVYSAAVTDGFFRDTEEVNARISPTRIAIEQSSSHVYLVHVFKRKCFHVSTLYFAL